MRIAATYDNGNIFQHFGKTENFKIYEVENNGIVSGEVISSNGSGHGALAGVLAEQAVQDYLDGKLVHAGATCSHHDHGEGHSCGDHEDGHSCGGHDDGHSCGGGCHGCGGHSTMEGKNVGKTVKVHYTGTFNDGTKFDSSYDRGQTLDFVCGAGMMIKGFDQAVANMEAGQIVDIHLMPEEAYGMPDPNAIFDIQISELPGSEELEVGQQVYLQNSMGQPFPVKVVAKQDGMIRFDANHEMAGKELNFKIELVEIC